MSSENEKKLTVEKELTVSQKVAVVGAVVLAGAQSASAAITAPDTTEIMTAIGLFGLAAITIKLAYIVYPIVMKAVGLLRS